MAADDIKELTEAEVILRLLEFSGYRVELKENRWLYLIDPNGKRIKGVDSPGSALGLGYWADASLLDLELMARVERKIAANPELLDRYFCRFGGEVHADIQAYTASRFVREKHHSVVITLGMMRDLLTMPLETRARAAAKAIKEMEGKAQ